MTQLYRLDSSALDVAQRFLARPGDDPWDSGYVAPGRFAPIITAGREFVAGPRPASGRLQPRLTPRLWGVMPPPSAHDPLRRITSVRNPNSPFWIGNLRNSEFRCLVPATSVMLWGSGTDYEGRRLKHWFVPKRGKIFAMAGVWKDEEVPGFSLLIRESAGAARKAGCTSMPAILEGEEMQQSWLHDGWGHAEKLLNAAPDLTELPESKG